MKGKCTCWLGDPGATFGSSDARMACTVHGDQAPARLSAHRLTEEQRGLLEALRVEMKDGPSADPHHAIEGWEYSLYERRTEALSAALRLDDAQAACEPFLKDGETVVECIERHRKDIDALMTLLRQEKVKADNCAATAETALARLTDAQAAREGQRCETCRFAGSSYEVAGLIGDKQYGRYCGLNPSGEHHVPLTIDGQPFGCRGHKPKEAKA